MAQAVLNGNRHSSCKQAFTDRTKGAFQMEILGNLAGMTGKTAAQGGGAQSGLPVPPGLFLQELESLLDGAGAAPDRLHAGAQPVADCGLSCAIAPDMAPLMQVMLQDIPLAHAPEAGFVADPAAPDLSVALPDLALPDPALPDLPDLAPPDMALAQMPGPEAVILSDPSDDIGPDMAEDMSAPSAPALVSEPQTAPDHGAPGADHPAADEKAFAAAQPETVPGAEMQAKPVADNAPQNLLSGAQRLAPADGLASAPPQEEAHPLVAVAPQRSTAPVSAAPYAPHAPSSGMAGTEPLGPRATAPRAKAGAESPVTSTPSTPATPASSGAASSAVSAPVAPAFEMPRTPLAAGEALPGPAAALAAAPGAAVLPAPVHSVAPPPMATVPLYAPDWPEGLVSGPISALLDAAGGSMVLDITPEELGRMTISLTVQGESATVRILTETPEAARLLSEAERQLASELARFGMSLAGHEASADRRGSGAQGARGRGAGHSGADIPDPAPSVPGSVRLVNLIA